MTFPAAVTVTFRPGASASFGNTLVLGAPLNGVLGSNVLGTTAQQAINITDQVRQVSIRRGRDRQFDTYLSGTATIELLDLDGDWNPNNTSSPYFGELKAGRQLRVSASYQSVDAFLFSGYVTNYQWRFSPEFDANIVTISASDGFRILDQGTLTTVAGSADGDTTGQRVTQILDQALWPASLRDVTTDGVTVQANPTDRRSPLAAAQQVEQTELGALFVDAAGRVVFRSRAQQALAATTTPTVFTDDPNPLSPVVRYTNVEVRLDDEEIVNLVTAERIGGAVQQVDNAASIEEFFTRSRSFTDLLHQTDGGALALANQVVNYRSQPELEIRSVTVQMLSNETPRVTAGLTLDVGDPILVERFAVGGTITSSLTVQGIQHNIGLSSWSTTFSTAEPLSFAFVLGSSLYGVLGTSTL